MARQGIKLNMDMSNMSLIQGNMKGIAEGNDDEYLTRIDMILPTKLENVAIGKYRIEYNESIILTEITNIEYADVDPILNVGKGCLIGASGSGLEVIPFIAVTDNRGKYPAKLLTLLFPYRIGSWPKGPNPVDFLGETYDYEEMRITGIHLNKDKIEILKAVNRLCKQHEIDNPVVYDDVTVFMETYYTKSSHDALVQRLSYLTSKDAYKNAVYDYVLPELSTSGLKKSIKKIESDYSKESIENETDLKLAVDKVIEEVLKHHIETRRWIEPFWDGQRKTTIDGVDLTIPRTPKNEPKIQPTLHVILDLALDPLGVQVVRESNEGIGFMDFRFLFTTKEGKPISVGVEFKVAHHQKIGKGIKRQLPSYLKAIRSKSGTYVVMWFKDKKYFLEPKNHDLKHLCKWLNERAIEVSNENKIDISVVIIDASIRPSASHL